MLEKEKARFKLPIANNSIGKKCTIVNYNLNTFRNEINIKCSQNRKNMKRQFINMLIIVIAGAININGKCDPDIKPLPSCSWKQNGTIGFKTFSITFPAKGDKINLDNDLYYFNQWLCSKYGYLGSSYDGKKLISFQDIYNYDNVYSDRTSQCKIDVSTTANGCSNETLSQSKTYTTLNKSDISYTSSPYYPCQNELKNQYYGYSSSDYTVTSDKNTMKVTVTFGPIKDNVSSKMGNVIWTGSAKIGPDNTFNYVGTFKATEVSVKSIYIGNKFINELL